MTRAAAQLRRYVPGDQPRVLAVWEAALRQSCPFLDDRFVSAERERISEQHLPRCECWVACDDAGDVVGFVALLGHQIGGLFVDPRAQGHGHGRSLVDKAVALRGAVELDVFERNAIARRFYARYGFVERGSHVHEETGETELRLALPHG